MSKNLNENKKQEKWDFSDYAYSITGIIVVVLLVVPEILYSQFCISILGGSVADIDLGLDAAEYDRGLPRWGVNELRALSPLLFLLTTAIVFFQEAISARKTGGYKGSMFTHTFESLFEEAIYMTITTIMVFGAVLFRSMYVSWLAGPITWILFICIFPLVRKKRDNKDNVEIPRVLLFIFVLGVVAEVITRVWIAFPLSWLFICMIKLVETARQRDHSIDNVFNIIYYAFSVILMAVGVGFGFWLASWAAFPIALLICWVINKYKQRTWRKS